MELLKATLLGDPVPKGRPRAGKGHHYTPARTRNAEGAWRELVERLYRDPPYEGPVSLSFTFWCATRRRTDADNLMKLVTDAIQRGRRESGGVIMDDSQIEEWYCRVYRRVDGEEPRTEIRAWALA